MMVINDNNINKLYYKFYYRYLLINMEKYKKISKNVLEYINGNNLL